MAEILGVSITTKPRKPVYEVKAWERRHDWSNPFGGESDPSSHNNHRIEHKMKKEKKKRKKKKGSRRHMTDMEMSEMSSKADSMLDELLGDDDDLGPNLPQVEEATGFGENNTGSLGIVRTRTADSGGGVNPFEDPEEEAVDGDEIDKQGYKALLQGQSFDNDDKAVIENEDKHYWSSDEDCVYVEDDKREVQAKGGHNPFEEEEPKEPYLPENYNPFEDESEADDEASEAGRVEDDDISLSHQGNNPFEDDSVVEATVKKEETKSASPKSHQSQSKKVNSQGKQQEKAVDSLKEKKSSRKGKNPFEDDSVVASVNIKKTNSSKAKQEKGNSGRPKNKKKSKEQHALSDRTASESYDSQEQIETKLNATGLVETKHVIIEPSNKNLKSSPKRGNKSAKGKNNDNDDDDDEEDIVESSKRLLRMCDERIKYQEHNDEIKMLKDQIETMKAHAELLSEQLRRAIETKCDLVLAQTELERLHEREMMMKDEEIYALKLYVKQVKESQANNELHFMNEIASLSKNITDLNTKHKTELSEKDFTISQLEAKISSMKTGSVRNNASRSAFKNRFLDSDEVIHNHQRAKSTTSLPHPSAVVPSVECA